MRASQSRQDPSPNGYPEERARKRSPARLPGEEIESAWTQAHLRRLAYHGHIGWIKKVADLELKDTPLFSETSNENKVLELLDDELYGPSFAARERESVGLWADFVSGESPGGCGLRHGRRAEQSRATCERLWKAIPEGYKRASCYSDFWEAYRQVIPEDQHEATGKEEGETCHVERWINTLRQRLSHQGAKPAHRSRPTSGGVEGGERLFPLLAGEDGALRAPPTGCVHVLGVVLDVNDEDLLRHPVYDVRRPFSAPTAEALLAPQLLRQPTQTRQPPRTKNAREKVSSPRVHGLHCNPARHILRVSALSRRECQKLVKPRKVAV